MNTRRSTSPWASFSCLWRASSCAFGCTSGSSMRSSSSYTSLYYSSSWHLCYTCFDIGLTRRHVLQRSEPERGAAYRVPSRNAARVQTAACAGVYDVRHPGANESHDARAQGQRRRPGFHCGCGRCPERTGPERAQPERTDRERTGREQVRRGSFVKTPRCHCCHLYSLTP